MPKRKEVYDTYYDPKTNEVVTTKEKKFNRLKYNTEQEYYTGSSSNKRANQVKGQIFTDTSGEKPVQRRRTDKEQFLHEKNQYVKMQEDQRKKRTEMESDLADLRKLYDN